MFGSGAAVVDAGVQKAGAAGGFGGRMGAGDAEEGAVGAGDEHTLISTKQSTGLPGK